MLAVFSPIFVADTKITSVYNSVAPVISSSGSTTLYQSNMLLLHDLSVFVT